jgi:hypothetical protein
MVVFLAGNRNTAFGAPSGACDVSLAVLTTIPHFLHHYIAGLPEKSCSMYLKRRKSARAASP